MQLPLHRLPEAAGGGVRSRRPQEGRLLIGDRVKLATGRATFVADLDMPGTLTAHVLRSPHPRARIRAIDPSAALALPGVVAVLTAADAEARSGPTLFAPVVQHVGDRVAAVAALDRELAERGAEAIRVDYELEEPRLDLDQGLVIEEAESEAGSPGGALERAERFVEACYRWPFALEMPLEPPASMTWLDEDGRLVVRASVEAPFYLRHLLGGRLGLPASRLRVVRPQVGAPFGDSSDPAEADLCAALTLRTGRPVRLIERHGRWTAGAHAAHRLSLKAALGGGRLSALEGSLVFNAGASARAASETIRAVQELVASYGVPHCRLRVRVVSTNLAPVPGLPGQAVRATRFALEGLLAEAAEAADQDPLSFRMAHLAGPSAAARAALIQQGAESIGWERHTRARAVTGVVRRGLGLAVTERKPSAPAAAAATLSRNEDGSVTLRVGASGLPTGVGQRLVALAAEALGLDEARIALVPADTDAAVPEEGARAPEPYLVARAVARAGLALRERITLRADTSNGSPEVSVTAGMEEWDSCFGAVLADVEVDTETGEVRVRRLAAVVPLASTADVALFESWLEGDLLTGVALALSGGPAATTLDTPEIAHVRAGTRTTDSPLEPLPELRAAAAAAVAQAVGDALRTHLRHLPMTPARVLAALEERAAAEAHRG